MARLAVVVVAAVELFLLILLIASRSVESGVVVQWEPSPSIPLSIDTPDTVSAPQENHSSTPDSFFPLIRQGGIFNDSVSVPITERIDTTTPFPATIAADDFKMPLALQSCSTLIADLVLVRQLGRETNYRMPRQTTIWLLSEAQVKGPFNRSKALAERSFTSPSEGQYDPVGSTGGRTIDRGHGYFYHIERMRFVIENITLRSNTTYWLAAMVSIERAYNSNDYSQNAIRWAVSDDEASVNGSGQYRIVDWHGNSFRDVPQLGNWSDANVAEYYVLPSMTSLNVRASRTKQLALDIYATKCTNVTRLPDSLTILTSLPLREETVWPPSMPPPPPPPQPSPSFPSPSWPSPSLPPTKEIVMVNNSPSGSPSYLTSSTEPQPHPEPQPVTQPSPQSSPEIAPEPSPSPALSSSPNPLILPSPLPSPSFSVPSSLPPSELPSPSPLPTPPPPPIPSPLPDFPNSSAETPSPSPSSGSNDGNNLRSSSTTPITAQTWVLVGLAIAIGVLLVLSVLFVIARRLSGNRRYTESSYEQYLRDTEQDDEGSLSNSDDRNRILKQTDASTIPLDDFGGSSLGRYDDDDDVDDDDNNNNRFPRTPEEAEENQSNLLMEQVSLTDKPKKNY